MSPKFRFWMANFQMRRIFCQAGARPSRYAEKSFYLAGARPSKTGSWSNFAQLSQQPIGGNLFAFWSVH
jgi:hypothetical protein